MIRLAESQYLEQMGLRDLYRFARTIYHWSSLNAKTAFFPEFIWIETTNACNLRCRMCPQSQGEGRPTGTMSAELYTSLLKQCQDKCYGVFLFFGGDPLCDKNFPERISEARNAGLRVFVHTNATLLDEETTQKIIAAAPTTISFSLDTADESDYEYWRNGAAFSTVIKNVKYFTKQARQANKPPLTIIQLIDKQGDAVNHEKKLRELLEPYQPDLFRIRPLHDWAGELGPELGYQSTTDYPYYPCVLLWKALVVCWDGKVAACCNDLNGKYIIGDANNDRLHEIFTGEKMIALRKLLIAGKKVPALCHDCVNLHNPLSTNPLFKLARSILGGSRRVGKET